MPFNSLPNSSRLKRLTSASHDQHERLDAAIKTAGTFADREHYGLFLQVQRLFHRDMAALYTDERIIALLPGIAGHGRLGRIEQDLADLGLTPIETEVEPLCNGLAEVDFPAALGWLCVAEGSRLGAVILLKRAEKLGFTKHYGARHLAPHPDGTGDHWKAFTAAFDAVDFSHEEEERAIAGGCAAFARVLGLVDQYLPTPEGAGASQDA